MSVLIKGIKIDTLSITREDGHLKVGGSYQLISSKDTILATQPFNGYNGMKLDQSSESKKLMYSFMDSVVSDIETTLGLKGE